MDLWELALYRSQSDGFLHSINYYYYHYYYCSYYYYHYF